MRDVVAFLSRDALTPCMVTSTGCGAVAVSCRGIMIAMLSTLNRNWLVTESRRSNPARDMEMRPAEQSVLTDDVSLRDVEHAVRSRIDDADMRRFRRA